MKRIGGNITGKFQTRTVTTDSIGEQSETWTDVLTVSGFLDYSGGQNNIREFNTKLEESTHIFICDYVTLTGISARDSRMVINSKNYEILEIDNPMELNEHLEIYLKYIGVA